MAIAVSLSGVLWDLSFVLWKGRLRTFRIDDRFGDLASRLAPGERVGFVTDVPGALGGRRYFDAEYALAPAVVLIDPDHRLVVADLGDPAALGPICARLRLRVVVRPSPGVALLERE